MDVKALYRRFRAWQKEPLKYDRLDGKVRQCANCGTSFEGKYCPVCGQSAGVGKVDWKSVDKDVKSILKVDDASNFFPFLIQLFGRTGYLISGIYIQVFMSSLVLIFVLLRCLAGDWILIFIPIFYIIAYRSLFGYGVWGTIWRTLLSIGIVFYFFGVAITAVKCLQGNLILVNSVWGSLAIIAALLAAGVGILFLGYHIGKRTTCSKTDTYDRSRSI